MKKNFRPILLCIIILTLVLNGCGGGSSFSASGKITDTDGNPLPGIKIISDGKVKAEVTTNNTGNWSLTGLKGTTKITPVSSEWGFDPPAQTVSSTSQNINFVATQNHLFTLDIKGNGTVTIYPDKDRYKSGERITLTPNPENGYLFSHWSGDITNDTSPLEFFIDGNKAVSAVFINSAVEVQIADANLLAAVRTALNKPFGIITKEEALSLHSLTASVAPINSLAGIEEFKNLTWLNLSITDTSEIAPLAGLTSLEYLDLSSNSITEIDDLKDLVKLTTLNLNNNDIQELDPLIWFSGKDLTNLNLGSNRVKNISILADLKKLERLDLSDNLISDIGTLNEIASLRELDLSDNQISTLKKFDQLTNLEILSLANNQFTDISEIVWLWDKSLQELNLSDNQISWLEPLENLTTLEKLDLGNCQIDDLHDLSGLTNLEELYLNDNQIDDLNDLVNLYNLNVLYLHNNQLADISPLVSLVGHLEQISILGNDDLNLSVGSDDQVVVQTLIDNGIEIVYDFFQNDAPIINPIGTQTLNETETLSFTVLARDPDGDQITFSATGDNAHLFDPATQLFEWITGYEDAGVYNLTFTVSDGLVDVSEQITIQVFNRNRLPDFDPLIDQQIDENQELTITLNATDQDGQILTYSATSNDLNVSDKFDPNTRTFSWTPTYDDSGQYHVTFSVNDGEDQVDQDVMITVNHVNRPPVITAIDDKNISELAQLTFPVVASDPDGDQLTYSASCSTNYVTSFFDPNTQVFDWLTTYNDSGVYLITFTVSDGNLSVNEDVTVTVGNLDRPPVLTSIGDKTIDEYSELQFMVIANDDDGDPINYSMTGLDPSAFNESTGEFKWTPTITDIGVYTVTFTAEALGQTVDETITITVNDIEFAPVLHAIGDQSIDENQNLTFVLDATDNDLDPLTFSATSSDLVISDKFDPNTMTFNWTPTYDDSGVYVVTFEVDDGDQIDSEVVTITVNHVNRPPTVLPIADITITENDSINFTVSGTDPDGDGVVFSASGDLITNFDENTQVFDWVTDYDDEGIYHISFIVSDGQVTATENVTITVNKLDRSPVLATIGNKTVNDNELLNFTVVATDPDNDSITYSATYLDGVSLNSTSGEFNWTPNNSQIGSNDITIRATADGVTVEETITITVIDVEHAPVLDPIGPQSVYEDQELIFTLTASDLDQDPLTFEAYGDHADKFDPNTQTFTWKPSFTDNGIYTIALYVRDGKSSAHEEVQITVIDVDATPVIQAIDDKSVNQGDALFFKVDASDPDNDPITLSINNLPTGASFNTNTGDFSWTPTTNDIGTYDLVFTATANGKSASENVTVTVLGAQLNIESLLISDSTIEVGQNASITATIRNTGNVDTGLFTVVWEIYNNLDQLMGTLGQDSVTNITPDNVSNIIKNFTLSLALGVYELRATADSNGLSGGPAVSSEYFEIVQPEHTLTINVVGNGTVMTNPTGTTYVEGTSVTLTAVADEGWVFDSWSGALSGTTNPETLTIDTDKTVTAQFNRTSLPDKLAFISDRDSPFGEIYVMDINGVVSKVTDNTDLEERNLQWSPDGTELLFEARSSEGWDIYAIAIGSSMLRRLTYHSAEDVSATWSPDGSKIIFISDRSGGKDVWWMNADGSNSPIRLTYNINDDLSPIWSPDGSYIVHVYDGQIWIMDANGGSKVALTDSGIVDSCANPRWSPDGVHLIFETGSGDLYAVKFTGSPDLYSTWNPAVKVTTDPGTDLSPAWNETGSKIAFVSDRSGNNEIYILSQVVGTFENADPGGTIFLTSNSGSDTSPIYSADGSTIAFVSDRDGDSEIYVINADGSNLIRLTNNTGNDTSPVWAP